MAHDWPGNVRELAHFAERIVLGIAPELNPFATARAEPLDVLAGRPSLAMQIDAYEAALLRDALARHNGDVRAAADVLGIAHKTLYDKPNRHRIDPGEFR